jgi:hypothetical protein
MSKSTESDRGDKTTTRADAERKRMFDRVEEINASWLERMGKLRGVEADFSAKFLASSGPEEAMSICNHWMAKRLELIGKEQQALAKSWVEILGLLGDSAKSAFKHPAKISG